MDTGMTHSRNFAGFSYGTWGRLATGVAIGSAIIISQAAAQGLGNHDVNAPVSFSADRIEVQDRADRVVISGNVQVNQAGMQVNSSRMTIAYSQAGGTQVNRIDATGGVTVRRADQIAKGSVAIYDLDRKLITMVGNVELTQGANRLNGGRLLIDLNTGRATVDGTGGSAPVRDTNGNLVPGSGGGRVSGTFTVPQRGN